MNENLLKGYALSIIIGELINDTKISEQMRLNSYIEAFKFIYSDDYRHEYSKVTRLLFDIENPEQTDFIAEQLNFIASNIEDREIKNKLNKLSDHINLEIIRMRELSRIAENANKASEKAVNIEKKVNDSNSKIINMNQKILGMKNATKNFDKKIKGFNKDIRNAENQLNELHKSVKNMTTEFVTILSIFAAIVIGFTGGMSYISNAITSLSKIGPYRAGVFILLIGIIMFDTIFLLLYLIGKLTQKYIGSVGKCKKGEEVCDKKSVWCCINRYPYVIWFNTITLMMVMTMINLYWIDRYDYLSKIFINFSWDKLFEYLPLILVLVLTYIPFIIIICKIFRNKCNCESCK